MDMHITTGNVQAVDEIMPAYRELFPASERKSAAVLKELIADGSYHLMLISDRTCDQRVGFAFVFEMPEYKTIWLDFIAIESVYQGTGIGSQVYKALQDKYQSACQGMYLEVEPISEDPQTCRRIRFYQRLGAIKLNYEYYLPTPDGGSQAMDLYYQAWQHDICPEKIEIDNVVRAAHQYIHRDLLF